MRHIKLGRTGLDVSPIVLGCMTYGEPARELVLTGVQRGDHRPGAELARISARLGISPAGA